VTSHRLDNEWVVASGLAAGDRVVVEGTGKVRPGAAVRPVALAAGK
jgi:membrane fusion protein (multidrug efflux system)